MGNGSRARGRPENINELKGSTVACPPVHPVAPFTSKYMSWGGRREEYNPHFTLPPLLVCGGGKYCGDPCGYVPVSIPFDWMVNIG